MPSTRIVLLFILACSLSASAGAQVPSSARDASAAASAAASASASRETSSDHAAPADSTLIRSRAAASALIRSARADSTSIRSARVDFTPIRSAPTDSTSTNTAPDDTLTHRLGEITVTASRIDLAAGEAPQRITVLTPADIEHSGARSLADLLAARAGLFVRRYGEGLATITLRGASPSQTLILFDGLRLTDPQLGQLDLSLLPTYALGSVEVLHGPGSALHGSAGVGGIVNLRPRGAGEGGLRLSSELGAFGERRVEGGASLTRGASGLLLAAEYAGSDGDFRYLNEALFPAREMRRRNADRTTRSLYAAGHLASNLHRLRGGFLYADADRGLPGLSTVAPSGERQWDEHVRLWMVDEIRLQPGTLSLRGFVHRSALRFADPSLGIDDTGRTFAGYAEGELAVPIGPRWIADGGLAAGYARADHPSLAAGAAEIHGSAFGEVVGRLGGVTVYPALRIDVSGDASDHAAGPGRRSAGPDSGERRGGRASVSPRLGVNVRLADTPAVRLKGAVGRAFRNPTFNERYWQPGGNPALRPERGWSYEVGLYAAEADASVEVTAFGAQTQDQILWTPDERGIWTPENLTRTVTTGLEASARAAVRPGRGRLDGGATFTFTRAVDRSDGRTYGRQLRYVPRHQVKGFAGWAVGPLQVDASARLIGRRFVTADETESLPPVLVVDLQAGVRRSAGPLRVSLFLFVENVLDREYALIRHYPMPPRHARLRLVLETRGEQ